MAAEESTVSVIEDVLANPLAKEAPREDSVPFFVQNSLYPTGEAIVFGLAEVSGQDIVLLDNGLDQGFRNGMMCEVFRGDRKIAEIILVEVRQDRAAGLILALQENNTIHFNDVIQIKTVQF